MIKFLYKVESINYELNSNFISSFNLTVELKNQIERMAEMDECHV